MEPGEADERVSGEPAPWFTGLAVTALSAFVIGFAMLALMLGLGAFARWLGLLAGVIVTAGLAPSVLLLRRVLGWRWAAYGIALGLVVGWLAWLANLP
jgi:hypothetical protein